MQCLRNSTILLSLFLCSLLSISRHIHTLPDFLVNFHAMFTSLRDTVPSGDMHRLKAQSFGAGNISEKESAIIHSTIGNMEIQHGNENQLVKVIELRNYVLKPGQRQNFTDLFESKFISSQQAVGSYPLGVFRVKGAEDNFFWIRGFHDMTTRKSALTSFYYGPVWKQYKAQANPMLLNNDNVHLLKPLDIQDRPGVDSTGFNANWFGMTKGIAVIDYFTANTKLDKLIEFVKHQYAPVLSSSDVVNCSFWVSEMSINDFPALPVFQDKNLLVEISFYASEEEYQAKMNLVQSKLSELQKVEMADLVTIKNTVILFPTEKSFREN